jgi:DNA-binding beta-propeller fold protein YncE
VVVCDRENFRLQVFTEDGEFIQQVHMHRPMAIAPGRGDDEAIYVGEAGPPPVQQGVPRLGQRVTVLDNEFNRITHFGADLPGEGPGQFLAPHGIALDSEGSVYVAEVAYTAYGSLQDPPREVISLRKWRRVSG